jgi:hypothetical protein
LKNVFSAVEHIVVPEAQYGEACFSQLAVTGLVRHRSVVLPAIDFDDKLSFQTNKVQNVVTKGMLPAKFHTELLNSKLSPKNALGVGRLPAQGNSVVT